MISNEWCMMILKRAIIDFVDRYDCPHLSSHNRCKLKQAGQDICRFPNDCPLPNVGDI